MNDFLKLMAGVAIVAVLIIVAINQYNAPQVAIANAEAAKAQADADARVAEANAEASTENLEETYSFLSPLCFGVLIMVAIFATIAIIGPLMMRYRQDG